MSGAEDIAAERRRQIDVEGYTPIHDAEHPTPLLAWAGASLAAAAAYGNPPSTPPLTWPSAWRWNPGSQREALVKAGALIAAAMDRLDNSQPTDSETER